MSQIRQKAFLAWAVETFGEVARDPEERLNRFIEEAIELAHAGGAPEVRLQDIIERVYSRPRGSVRKESGQALVTLEMFAEVIGFRADDEGAREFERVQKIPKEEWEARHRAKVERGIAK